MWPASWATAAAEGRGKRGRGGATAASGGLRPACVVAVLRGSAAVKEREEALGDPAESGSPLTLGGGGSWTALHGGGR